MISIYDQQFWLGRFFVCSSIQKLKHDSYLDVDDRTNCLVNMSSWKNFDQSLYYRLHQTFLKSISFALYVNGAFIQRLDLLFPVGSKPGRSAAVSRTAQSICGSIVHPLSTPPADTPLPHTKGDPEVNRMEIIFNPITSPVVIVLPLGVQRWWAAGSATKWIFTSQL